MIPLQRLRSGFLSVLSITTVLLLAGCTSDQDSGAPQTAAVPTAQISDTTGGILGSVLDEQGLPLPGAEVGLPAIDLTTRTDEGGIFTLSNVPPGTYNLHALLLGYESAMRPVIVTAGDVTEVEIELTPTAITAPYEVLLTQRGLFGCGLSWTPGLPPEPLPGLNDLPETEGFPNRIGGLAGCGSFSDEEFADTPLHDLDAFALTWQLDEPTPLWTGAVFEMQWTTNQLAGRGLSMVWETNECYNRGAFEFARAEGGSPLRAEADQDLIQEVIANGTATTLCPEAPANCNEDVCKIYSRVFAVEETTTSEDADIGVSFQQQYEMFLSAFFVGPAPEGFSAIEER